MAKADRERKPLYKVWCPDADQTQDDGQEYGAHDVRFAAQVHASRCFGADTDYSTAARVYHVFNPDDGNTYAVEVTIEMRPEFIGSKPQKLPIPPANHVLWGGRPLCKDIRIDGVPGRWPKEQTWTSLDVLATGKATIEQITCERCAKQAPQVINGIRAIGAGKDWK